MRAISQDTKALCMAPHARDFLQKVAISSAGMTKMLRKLLNDGIVEYRAPGYGLTDPLLVHYLRRYRAGF